MIDVAQAATPSSDSWAICLTIICLIIQTAIIAFQTDLFRRQTKILEKQARLSESVDLSIQLVHQDPITSPSNQVRLKVVNEGKGVAMVPQIDCVQMNFESGTMVSGSSHMQSIGPGRHEEVTINLTGPITPHIPLTCYWAATGTDGLTYRGSHELSFQ